MRIHSDILKWEDLNEAARKSRTWLEQADSMRSTKRAGAHEVTLGGLSKSSTQRFRDVRAATYNQWGVFLNVLFEIDPQMIAGQYDGVDDFHNKTTWQFDGVDTYTTDGDDRVAKALRDPVTV